MNDSFLEKELARARLKLDAETRPGTADKLLRDRLAERMEYYGKMDSPKSRQILARLATNGLPTDQALAVIQTALGEVLASAVTSSPKQAPQPAPAAPASFTPPPPPAPKKTPEQVQAEADTALLDAYAVITDPQERVAWYRENKGAYDRAHSRVVRALEDAKEQKRMAAFRKAQTAALTEADTALAEQFTRIRHPLARYQFAQAHPGLMAKIQRGEIS